MAVEEPFTGAMLTKTAFMPDQNCHSDPQESNATAIPFVAQAVYEFDLRVKENPS